MVRKRERKRRPARRTEHLDVRRLILVVCEGEKTEPQYLKGIERGSRKNPIRVEIAGGKGVPKSVVECAKKLKTESESASRRERDDNLRYDEVWCVFDVDDHPNLLNALESARQLGIKVALSNPCFELWLLLHFRESPGAQQRHKIRDMLREFVPGYQKEVDIEEYLPTYGEAVRRAEHMEQSARSLGEIGMNPSTGVWRLTESIRSD